MKRPDILLFIVEKITVMRRKKRKSIFMAHMYEHG